VCIFFDRSLATSHVKSNTNPLTKKKEMSGGIQKVANDFTFDIPSADPSTALKEIERRAAYTGGAGGVAGKQAGGSTLLSPEAMASARAEFYAEFSGHWVINSANVDFSTRCDCPNIRLLQFVPEPVGSGAKSDAVVRKLMSDPRVTSIPIKVPTHVPFQIAVSEASAANLPHTHMKIQRNIARYRKLSEVQSNEFKKHVEATPLISVEEAMDAAGVAPATAAPIAAVPAAASRHSQYSRRKLYLRRLKNKEQDRDGLLPPLAEGIDISDVPLTKVDTTATAPPSIWQGELPEHWKHVKGSSTATADEWPRDLEDRRGRFAVLAFLEDEDVEADSPEFPAAAGREPIVILFGGAHESVEAATKFLETRIGPWCPDLSLDVVDMYEWLWPTEVDPDSMEEKHRTQFAGHAEELNTVMQQRKKTIATAAQVRKECASIGAVVHQTSVNALPDISRVVAERKDGMVMLENVGSYDDIPDDDDDDDAAAAAAAGKEVDW
jgi:hypothetical protein